MDIRADVAAVGGIRMHYLHAGTADRLLVLLHGWPQTSYCWRRLIGPLAEHYRVVAPDLRGYGLTDKAIGGYDKRTMAEDVHQLVSALGHERVTLIGHDRGARVAHRYALDHPDEVERLAVLDIIPTRAMWQRMNADLGSRYWHWLFHLKPDLPELLVAGREAQYLAYFFERWTFNRRGLDADAVAEYVRAFCRPGALRAGFDDYRASFPLDAADDDASAGRRLTMPLLVLWGAESLFGRLPALDIWREYAEDVRGAAIPACGHFLPEEQPDAVLEHLRTFLPLPTG